jgi:hypothetical protein
MIRESSWEPLPVAWLVVLAHEDFDFLSGQDTPLPELGALPNGSGSSPSLSSVEG